MFLGVEVDITTAHRQSIGLADRGSDYDLRIHIETHDPFSRSCHI